MLALALVPAAYGWPVCGASEALASARPEVRQIVDQVTADSLSANLVRMVGFGTRFIGSDSGAVASRWLADRLLRLGYQSVRFDTFSVSADRRLRVLVDGTSVSNRFVFQGLPQWNVVAEKPGVLRPGTHLVLGAHFDSISIDRDQADQDRAPGADDNASGVAALLEAARVLAQVDLEVTVVFALFGAEELGLIGSRDYVQRAEVRGDDIVAMLQLDSIGSRSSVFPDAFTIDTIGPYLPLGETVAQAAEDYTDIRSRNGAGGRVFVTDRGSQFSDHQSFIDGGYPGLGILQYVDNAALHLNTSRDTLGVVDATFATEVARAALGGVLELAGFPARSPDLDGDGRVALRDFELFVSAYGQAADGASQALDLDRDGWIAFSDFLLLAANYGRVLRD